MLPLISVQRREQALRYKHTLGQFCCLKSWLMLKELMAKGEWSESNGEWAYNEHGKPYIKGGQHFSISHCKEGIAVAVDEQPIGIDIEGIRHADDELIKRVLNEEERRMVERERDRDRAFTRLWTQKEAMVKAQGVGITSFEQLKNILGLVKPASDFHIQTFESEKYIYSIAHK